ncbi:MAG: acyl-phosphate glycerol 3-phosphate acyltransferase [Anaerolineales bacterium]|nr:acyl-phosphate glycerol 3-phosphate acyltransferase [Anaerolineales bacterium]
MRIGELAAVLVGAYILGSFPVGLLVVKLLRGRDIRYWFSGRTGGTNVMRMAGFWAGFFTALIDLGKGTLAVFLARWLTPGQPGTEVAAGLLAIVGHNHSIFLLERKEGKLRLRGGAGGATTGGVVLGLWPPALLILVPIGLGMLYGVGYASLATMSIGIATTLIFLIRALTGQGPWAYVVFGVIAEGLLIFALRPNIQRLLKGEERLVGWRARKARQQEQSKQVNGNAQV